MLYILPKSIMVMNRTRLLLQPSICPNKNLEQIRNCTSEADIVDYGLQTVMEMAGQGIKETANEFALCKDLRTAAYIFSIRKIFRALESSGITQQ